MFSKYKRLDSKENNKKILDLTVPAKKKEKSHLKSNAKILLHTN